MQVRIDPAVFTDIKSDVEFASLLVEEESVVVLPGKHSILTESIYLHVLESFCVENFKLHVLMSCWYKCRYCVWYSRLVKDCVCYTTSTAGGGVGSH
jgi:hypothetical protein